MGVFCAKNRRSDQVRLTQLIKDNLDCSHCSDSSRGPHQIKFGKSAVPSSNRALHTFCPINDDGSKNQKYAYSYIFPGACRCQLGWKVTISLRGTTVTPISPHESLLHCITGLLAVNCLSRYFSFSLASSTAI